MGVVDTEIVETCFPYGAPYLIAVKRDIGVGPWGMYWGSEGFILDSASVIGLYWPETMELECFSSEEDGWLALQWLKGNQDVWRDKVLSTNNHEPSRQRKGRTAQ